MTAREEYEGRLARYGALLEQARRRSSWISHGRLATFAVGALSFFLGFYGGLDLVWLATGGALAVVFVVLVIVHNRLFRRVDELERFVAVNEDGVSRLDHDWENLPLPAAPDDAEGAPLANDLDLFGERSLFHLLGTVKTVPGRTTLARWLLAPSPVGEILARQEAVLALATAVDFRERLEAEARPLADGPPKVEPFVEWSESGPWIRPKKLLVWTSRVIPVLTIGLAAMHVAGSAPPYVWVLPMAVALVLAKVHGRHTFETFERVSNRSEHIKRYVALLRLLSESDIGGAKLSKVREDLTVDGLAAHRQMARFARIMELSDTRHSGMIHLPLVAFLMWDFQVLQLLERWQEKCGPHVRRWLDALGEAEALAALAALRFDNPEWCLPDLSSGSPPRLTAQALGHPLLHESRRVANDVELGPTGTFLLVTGSNMSGKTTLLRSLGVATTLAQAGGPVCASAMSLPPLTIATSIRIRDSLADGVSYFMAEVRRIKAVLEEVTTAREEGRTLLYLLDEILQGTNSAERRVAVRGIISALLDQEAIGAVSTHDLSLGNLEGLAKACQAVHFTETWQESNDGPTMSFDYTLREGIAQTTNALKLLESVGVRVGTSEDEGPQ